MKEMQLNGWSENRRQKRKIDQEREERREIKVFFSEEESEGRARSMEHNQGESHSHGPPNLPYYNAKRESHFLIISERSDLACAGNVGGRG